jgi:2-(1,2-epoxy-1,2-dihydrophenyl)acetyl-CoA isomerase
MTEAAKPAVQEASAAGPCVLEERSEAVFTIRLNRPNRLNALSAEMGHALVKALLKAGRDDSIRAVIITGEGRGFCAGGNLKMLQDARKRKATAELKELLEAGKEIILAIAMMNKPVIASVNGPAAGGGMNMAVACDFRIASEEATFGESFAQVGLFPDFGGTFFLPRLVGPSRAAELFFTGEMVDAKEAYRIGLVNRVVAADKLQEETQKWAMELAAAPPLALRSLKRILTSDKPTLEAALDEENRQQVHCFESEDAVEGFAAFFEKRKPSFRGR